MHNKLSLVQLCNSLGQHSCTDFAFNFFEKKYKTPKTGFSEPGFSEILDLMNKLQLPFSYSSLYPDSI